MSINPSGEVDTLNMLFDKLESLFNESQGYYESFLDTNNMYKKGQMSDKEFFEQLGDYVVAYSALEFLAIKVMFEIRKAIKGSVSTQSPGLMPGMSSGMMGSMSGMGTRVGSSQNPAGRPPGIVSAKEGFGQVGTLPTPDPTMVPKRTSSNACRSCGSELRPNAKFCAKCGTKTN